MIFCEIKPLLEQVFGVRALYFKIQLHLGLLLEMLLKDYIIALLTI
jgi:hypothetical protein